MILVRNLMILNFNKCFLDMLDLADIFGMTVSFVGFLMFAHFGPSSSPGSQHFFFLDTIPNLAKASLNYPAYSISRLRFALYNGSLEGI